MADWPRRPDREQIPVAVPHGDNYRSQTTSLCRSVAGFMHRRIAGDCRPCPKFTATAAQSHLLVERPILVGSRRQFELPDWTASPAGGLPLLSLFPVDRDCKGTFQAPPRGRLNLTSVFGMRLYQLQLRASSTAQALHASQGVERSKAREARSCIARPPILFSAFTARGASPPWSPLSAKMGFRRSERWPERVFERRISRRTLRGRRTIRWRPHSEMQCDCRRILRSRFAPDSRCMSWRMACTATRC